MATTFFYSLAGGMLVALAAAPLRQIAPRFLRLVGFLALTLSCTALWWVAQTARTGGWTEGQGGFTAVLWCGIVHGSGAMVLIFLAPFSHRTAASLRVVCGLGGAAGLVGASILAQELVSGTGSGALWPDPLIAANQVLAAVLLGSITVAWLLGHAYLTATRMTIAPLRRLSDLLAVAVVMRLAFFAGSAAFVYFAGADRVPPVASRLAGSWLIVSIRLVVGLLAVAVFAYMVRDCVRLRATQSATGILYFGSVFAYMGELASQHLLKECGWPL